MTNFGPGIKEWLVNSEPIMRVKEIHAKKQMKFKLKNVHSKNKINTAPIDPKLPALCVFVYRLIIPTFLKRLA